MLVALWFSLLPWLDDPRWLGKGDAHGRGQGSPRGLSELSTLGMAPGMEPVEEVLEALQERVLQLFAGQLVEASPVSSSSTPGGEMQISYYIGV